MAKNEYRGCVMKKFNAYKMTLKQYMYAGFQAFMYGNKDGV